MTDPIILVNDIIAQIELSERYQTTQETLDNVESYYERYKGSRVDMQIIADRLKSIGEAILDNVKEDAFVEAELYGHDKKFEWKGNKLTPTRTTEYEYEPDDYISKVEKDLKPIETQLKGLKAKEKGLKDSIKSRQKELVKEGKATVTKTNNYLKIAKK